jgi:mevalonate kinase
MDISYRTQVGASAPGKVIIFGEHFVVYNSEAIVAAINRRCFGRAESTENLGVRIDSDLQMEHYPYNRQHTTNINAQANKKLLEPLNTFCRNILKEYAQEIGLQIHLKSELAVGVGLGSSAASCVMLAGILRSIITGTSNKEISSHDRKWVFENALKGEQMIHNKSSGVDCYVSTFGGLVHFAGLTGTTRTTSTENRSLPLFLINTRKSHETSELVSHVRRFSRNRSKYFTELTKDASVICSSGIRAIAKGSLEEIGRLMTDNHKLLKEIGVSNKEIEKIIGICFRCGSLGAKITGAGGGGCILVLARPETIPAISAALEGLNLSWEAVDIANKGLIID